MVPNKPFPRSTTAQSAKWQIGCETIFGLWFHGHFETTQLCVAPVEGISTLPLHLQIFTPAILAPVPACPRGESGQGLSSSTN